MVLLPMSVPPLHRLQMNEKPVQDLPSASIVTSGGGGCGRRMSDPS